MSGIEVLLKVPWRHGWRMFRDPVAVLEARSPADVRTCLRAVDRAVASKRYHAAGYLSYEAAAAFGFRTHPVGAAGLPLVWFGLFPPDHLRPVEELPAGGPAAALNWTPSVPAEHYGRQVRRIKAHVETGHTYQTNLTFRLRAPFAADPRALFRSLYAAQRGPWSAYLDLGRHVICSASPELFFASRPGRIICEPMKGTARRGRSSAEDRRLALELRRSEKNRAENVMIVDVVRNDLGQVADIGGVKVPSLFDVSRYPNVWQMTSRVTARSSAPFPEIVEALFPAASVTGAPKIRSAEIIHELEDSPRGIYTGAIGCVSPDGCAHFNVAIRTICLDRERRTAEFGVGSGIVWDSREDDEYEECCLKAQVLNEPVPPFQLLETLAWSPAGGFELLERHLLRLRASAAYFGFRYEREPAIRSLRNSASGADSPVKVRLLLDRDGTLQSTSEPLPPEAGGVIRAALAPEPVNADEVWLYHKTTFRHVYDAARRARPGCDEVILWNAAGEITEGTVSNVVAEIGGRKVTPPVDAGLLPGTRRAEVLARGLAVEQTIRIDELRRVRRFWVINSVRGWREAEIVE